MSSRPFLSQGNVAWAGAAAPRINPETSLRHPRDRIALIPVFWANIFISGSCALLGMAGGWVWL